MLRVDLLLVLLLLLLAVVTVTYGGESSGSRFLRAAQRTGTATRARPTRNNGGLSYTQVCGLPAVQNAHVPLVLHGLSTQSGEWPWLTAIFKKTKTGIVFHCGGVLVTASHVLTAGHCVHQLPNLPVYPASSFVVVLGQHNILSFGDDQESQSKRVREVVRHPNYNSPRSLSNDVAVLVLMTRASLSRTVRPACLWSPTQPPPAITGAKGAVVGWGKTEVKGEYVSEEPRLVMVPIVSQETCLLSNADFAHLTSNTTFCAGDRNGAGPCSGDSGGGLYVKESFSDGVSRWVVRGLVSLALQGQEPGECDLTNYVVFTDLAKYRPWLTQVIPAEHFASGSFGGGMSGVSGPPPPTSPPRPPPHTAPSINVQYTTPRPPSVSGTLTVGNLPVVKLGSNMFYFSSKETHLLVTWTAARQFCKSNGMELAVIESLEMNRLVHAHCRTISSSYSPWLGATDAAQEGVWVWDATGQQVTLRNWWTYQPDGGRTQNCLHMYADDGKWGDKECSYTKPFVCQVIR